MREFFLRKFVHSQNVTKKRRSYEKCVRLTLMKLTPVLISAIKWKLKLKSLVDKYRISVDVVNNLSLAHGRFTLNINVPISSISLQRWSDQIVFPVRLKRYNHWFAKTYTYHGGILLVCGSPKCVYSVSWVVKD